VAVLHLDSEDRQHSAMRHTRAKHLNVIYRWNVVAIRWTTWT